MKFFAWPQRLIVFLQPLILLFLTMPIFSNYANEASDFPVLYKGRYQPAEAYARLWLYNLSHSPVLKKEDAKNFHPLPSTSLQFLWSLEFLGFAPYESAPLFWIGSADLKKSLGLTLTRDRFSLVELRQALEGIKGLTQDKKMIEGQTILRNSLRELERLHGPLSSTEAAFHDRLAELKRQALSPKEIGQILEQEYPLIQRLKNAGLLFKTLPSLYQEGDWFPLSSLNVKVYHPSSQTLKEVGNFTRFSDDDFQSIRRAYAQLAKAYVYHDQERILKAQQHMGLILLQAYQVLEGKVMQAAHGKQLYYPTYRQLKFETLYVHYPWIPMLIALYGIGACLLLISFRTNSGKCRDLASVSIGLAILCHTALLGMRCYILARPPVSNMFETVIYVPWIAACSAFFFPAFRKNSFAMLAACATAIGLLVILEVADLNQGLDQVQAVLDSQFWLLIHVLLVVGSYGIFILGAILGHFYLALFIAHRKETAAMKELSSMILQSMYGGATLLIAGTILGGIWAAESWGRFWDWDPKESWAFISSCFYLIWIHAYRFHRIASFGLAIGAVSGFLAISFTWYGVNYILGTGLHSYGFGSGGEIYYYAYLAGECLFLGISFWSYSFVLSKNKSMSNN